jgi:hypothetical protein
MSVAKALLAVILLAGIVWLAASSIGSTPGDHTQKYTFSQVLAQARTNPRVMQSVMFHPSTQEVEVRYQDGKSATVAYPVDASAFELQKVLSRASRSCSTPKPPARRTGGASSARSCSSPWCSGSGASCCEPAARAGFERHVPGPGPGTCPLSPPSYRAVATCASRRLETPASSESPSFRVRRKNCTWYPRLSGNVARGNVVSVT